MVRFSLPDFWSIFDERISSLVCSLRRIGQCCLVVPCRRAEILSRWSISALQRPRSWSRDQVSVTPQVIKDGSVAADVQTALKSVLDSALQSQVCGASQWGLDIRTGLFSVSPRYGSTGKIAGVARAGSWWWRGLTLLVFTNWWGA